MRTSLHNQASISQQPYHGHTSGLAELIILRQKLDETYTAEQKYDFRILKTQLLWGILSKRKAGEEVDLSNTELAGLNFCGFNLEKANLEGANLANTILTNANLSEAKL